jgi:hypothetical protein
MLLVCVIIDGCGRMVTGGGRCKRGQWEAAHQQEETEHRGRAPVDADLAQRVCDVDASPAADWAFHVLALLPDHLRPASSLSTGPWCHVALGRTQRSVTWWHMLTTPSSMESLPERSSSDELRHA